MEDQNQEITKSENHKITNSSSNRDRVLKKEEWLDELVRGCSTQDDLFGATGVFTKLKAALVNRILESEMDHHLGYAKDSKVEKGTRNRRNGHSGKTVHTENGSIDISIPRDREGQFSPSVIGKHQRRLLGFDEKVLALYARGMTCRDIQGHLRELYGTDVSPELISTVTDGVLEELAEWKVRPLEEVYPIVYIDALFVPVREGAHVVKKPFYIALGVTVEGTRDVLGVWSSLTEGAKHWLGIFSELKNRGLKDILFLCSDGLTGIVQAAEAAFPKAVVQTCIVHMIRAALRYVSYGDRKELVRAMRGIYTAPNEEAAKDALDAFEKQFGARYPSAVKVWRQRWPEVIPFLAYPAPIRRILYTTNTIESLNSHCRKVLRHRGAFPNDESVYKLLYLAFKHSGVRLNSPRDWGTCIAHFAIVFENRLPA